MIKRFSWVLVLVAGIPACWGFSLGGPIGNGGDAWQVPTIGYGLGGDLNAPKNIGEEFRRNTPVMYYAFDANFYEFFGPEGATGVGNAYAILNALTNVDNYSKQLLEFPTESRHQNYQAQALNLLDLKSETLGLMMEQLGATDPIRYAWTLHDRYHFGNVACPVGMEYLVVQRNFDIVSSPLNQVLYSPYVNDVLYSYQILEWCKTSDSLYPPALARAYPYSADPLADSYSPVASFNISLGDYYTGLTRDDVACLRYLLSTNNVNWETPAAGGLLMETNYTVQQLFPVYGGGTNGGGGWYNALDGGTYGTHSYAALVNFSQTNNAAAIQAAYPGLQLTLISNYFAVVTITNTVSYYTNFTGGSGFSLVIKKNRQQALQEFFVYRFDNIITNLYSTKTTAKIQTITLKPLVGAPAGSAFVTNITTKKVTLNIPNGEFYILPTNSACGIDIVSTPITFTNYTTNVITSTLSTNGTTTATNSSYAYSQVQVIPSIGHVYIIHPVTCGVTNSSAGLLRGIGRVNFVRADYDSLLGQYWQPVTNDYSMTMITNSKAVKMYFRRIVTQPDFLFTAQDMANGPDGIPGVGYGARSLSFDETDVLPGLAGPGTITTPTVFTYNKSGPVYLNASEGVMDGTPYFTDIPGNATNTFFASYFLWANFDGSTNDPVIFPNGTSIDNLRNQLLVTVSPGSLPLGVVGQPYAYPDDTPVVFTATGGPFTQPFAWETSGLPAGLTLSSDGTISGTPTQAGAYDFTLKLTDAVGRAVDWNYSILIQP